MELALLVLEFNSVAGGIYISDVLVKEAGVRILDSRTVCPGKYTVTLTGDVDALRSSLRAAQDSELGETITEHCLLPRVHQSVVSAINAVPEYPGIKSIGVIETYGIAACVRAADAGAKAAGVHVVEIRLANAQGGKCIVVFSGEQNEVEVALAAGSSVAEEMQGLINKIIIERPHECMSKFLES
ncbi:MAG: BMC domain-containing protein [Candidatus Aureabacteria bacterium]|nr:BMC domain-containing protein [Candidatus Auribacterota bacterium]